VTPPGTDLPVRSPLPLDPEQEAAVRESRTAAVTVITGPPGCGKSHTLAAVALDAVGRGESVLLATQSVHATDVLREVFGRYPGPTPVLFGDAEKREALIAELGAGSTPGHGWRTVGGSTREAESAAEIVDRLTDQISGVLELHWRAHQASRTDPILFDQFPGLWDAPLAEVARLFESRCRAGRLRRYLIDRRLRRLLRTTQPVDIAESLLEPAANHRAAAELAASEATDLGALWTRLGRAQAHAAEALGEELRHRVRAADRRDRVARRAMVELAGALRAGRQRRRQLLAGIDAVSLLRALPLWIGTVGDVEDLLPPTPGMFDLVILDEATHIDQLRAAPALARARRAVVSGDPQQLRFVSFVADVDVESVIARHGLADHAAQLDVRRNSAFDVAVGAAPVIRLTEHYRGVPHLIGFSAARFYDDRISTVTRHPRNDSLDAIETHVVVPDVADGVNVGEVSAVMRLVDQCLGSFDDVAVITPYRVQADAIENAILRRYGAEVSGLGLRAGTVHAFQGSEADAVVVSLALTPGDDAGRVRFLEDRRLFNVMITRARRQLHVVTSWPGASPLIKDYLRYADQPPNPPAPNQVGEWATRLAAELRRAGAPVTVGYPVGRWLVDLCIGEDSAALGVFCGVHSDGVGAHLARQRILSRAGWRLAEAFPTPYGPDEAVVAVELLGRWQSRSG